jgi:hypothetical protein
MYAPLHYVLLFPYGEPGWHEFIPSEPSPQGQRQSENVNQHHYYAYRLHSRPFHPLTLFYGGRLFQQYLVDAWASCEDSELH